MSVLDPVRGAAPRRAAADQRLLYTDADPLSLIPFARKVELCQQIDAAARARDPARRPGLGVARRLLVGDRHRPARRLRRPRRAAAGPLNVQIVVEQNGRRETGYHGMGGRYLYDSCSRSDLEPGDRHRSGPGLVNLESVAAPAGEMTVVLGPGWPGSFSTRRSATASRRFQPQGARRPSPGGSASGSRLRA
jgi:TldD protein